MRLISHSSVTPLVSSTRRRSSSPSPSRSAAVALAGVEQEVAVLLAHLRAAAHQPAAAGGVDQLPGLLARRVAERAAAGAGAHRLRRLAARADVGHAWRRSSPRRRAGRGTGRGPRPRPGGSDGVPVGERQAGGGHPHQLAGAGTNSAQSRHDGHVAAIGAGVHRHRAADRAGDAGQELEPGQPGRRRVLGHHRVQARRARRPPRPARPRSR